MGRNIGDLFSGYKPCTVCKGIGIIERPSMISSTTSNRKIHAATSRSHFQYDVALSFAGEDRKVVEVIATELRKNYISVFYDNFQKANLWGKKLSQHFKETYGKNTRFVIVFISEHYSLKDWTDFEFSIAREEAKTRTREFILPIRIDDTNIVGLHNDVGYLDLNSEGVGSIVETIIEKLKT